MATDEQDIALAPAEAETSPTAVRPQLRLHHFFALTAVAAVLLAINGPQQDYWSNSEFAPPKLLLTLFTAAGVMYMLLLSVAVTAVAYGIVWQRQGLVFFDQPGHWLLVEIGVVGLLGLVPSVVFRLLFSSPINFSGTDFPMSAMIAMSLYSLVMLFAVPLALNIYIGVKKCRETRWSLVFYIKAAGKLLIGLGSIVEIIMLLMAANRDRREQVPRDAGHWCGVWLQLACSGLQVGIAVFSVFNMYYMMSRM
jgi:hypothetical protein